MNLPEIDESFDLFEDALESFIRQYDIPPEFLQQPDHFAIKCADELDYIHTCHELGGAVEGSLWELEEGGRLLASGNLGATIAGHSFSMVEIMQPKPGKETDKGYVEHVEFTYPDLFLVGARLYASGVEGVEEQENPGHRWLNIPFSSDGLLEIKINDRALADVVEAEKIEGLLIERKT